MLCTERYLRYCRALPCTALCSAATIPLKCLHFVAFNSYVRTLILIINFAQTRWPTVNSIFCTRELLHGKWSMTDCHFQYWLHVWVWGCITHRCLSSLSLFCFQGVDTIRFQNRFPPDQWEDALASLLPQLNKDSECIWGMVLHLWCSNWGTILYILTLLSFIVLYCVFEHVPCQCVCVRTCVCVVVSVELSLLLRLVAIVCLCGSLPACVRLHCLPNVHSLMLSILLL